MTPPKDRDALVEVMARALCEADGFESSDWLHSDVTGAKQKWHEYKDAAVSALTAIESSGCFVGPVVATETMLSVGEEAIFITCQSSVNETDACWTAMQSANPYRKDPSQ